MEVCAGFCLEFHRTLKAHHWRLGRRRLAKVHKGESRRDHETEGRSRLGRRFEHATDGWACGNNSQTTRDVVESVLLGKSTGEGMIPEDAIVRTVAGRGISGSVETVLVGHISGKNSRLGFKTYEQGRRAFEGEAKDFIWCDEEPPLDVYVEMLYRLLTTKGLAWTTFTPLLGQTDLMNFYSELAAIDA